MAFNYELKKLDSKYSMQLRVDTDVFPAKFQYNGASTQNIFGELLTTLDELTTELKSGLDPENDRISLSLEHPNLIAVQSQHTLLLDVKMRLTVSVARGVRGNVRLSLPSAKKL